MEENKTTYTYDTLTLSTGKEAVRSLWDRFADIPIDDNDEILEPFMEWEVGTNRFDIWHWFDAMYPGGVNALMWAEDENIDQEAEIVTKEDTHHA